MRSFVAISLSGEAKEDFARAQRVLTVGRPVLEDNLHLTLVFLDDQPEEILEALHEELLALSAPSFRPARNRCAIAPMSEPPTQIAP
ncbi:MULTISPECIES: 2'-5' RNA ligase family protein [unclassified Ruegeria]|uniref:2'-5' RNA ligase family protein n=1 Tax=unclassified Ruegeria TaxID=2625375 RepID=UPI001AE6B0BE|nr:MULTISPECIES: 2'-5' RNA ligase family protein [unclassified Ruegeria]